LATNAEHCVPEDVNRDDKLGGLVNEVSENSDVADDAGMAALQEGAEHSTLNVPVEWP
jgi:hypothetical protein